MVSYAWTCSCCGRQFEELPTCWSAGRGPDLYEDIPDDEKNARAQLTPDVCVIDDAHFFLRGHIEIPIVGSPHPFVWSVWVSLSRESFETVIDTWDDEDRTEHGPFFGWLCSSLPYDPETPGLKTNVHQRPPGVVPYVEVEPTEHPLALEQRAGVAMDRVVAVAQMLLPRH